MISKVYGGYDDMVIRSNKIIRCDVTMWLLDLEFASRDVCGSDVAS